MISKSIKILLASCFILVSLKSTAQDDLMSLLEESSEDEPVEVTSIWKGMRLISGHTSRVLNPGVMDFVISHRFGRVNGYIDEFYGLDDSQIRLGLEYGIVKGLNVGIGRSSDQKVVDSYLKYQFLSQKTNGMPLTMTAFSSIAIKTGDGAFSDPEFDNEFSQRLYYSSQLLIARKISSRLSLQLTPSFVHRNTTRTIEDSNDIFALGVGGRFKLTNRTSLNVEYYPQFNKTEEFTDAFSVGFDIETGGHVFQLHVTNSRGMIEQAFITETNGEWGKGDLHMGFNVARSFNLGAKKGH